MDKTYTYDNRGRWYGDRTLLWLWTWTKKVLGLISQMRERKRQFYESFDITLLENIQKVKKLEFFFFFIKSF